MKFKFGSTTFEIKNNTFANLFIWAPIGAVAAFVIDWVKGGD